MNMRCHLNSARSSATPVGAASPYFTSLLLAICFIASFAATHQTALAQASQPTPPVSSQAWLKLPTIPVTMAQKVFILSVARTTKQQKQGLMFIHNLPANRGMIFVFRSNCRPTFWMKNTYIPLDLIYVSDAGLIRQHYTMAANGNAHHLYPSRHKILFAIEIRAGLYRKLGLQIGQKLGFPPRFLKAAPQHP